MKKVLYLLLLVPFAFLNSCDKEDVAPFDMTLTMGGVTMADNTFYTVRGGDVAIENFVAQALGQDKTDVANVIYYLDGQPLLGLPGNPFTGIFSTVNIPAGKHSIGVAGTLLQVDHSIKSFAVSYPLVIVDNEEDLPGGAPALGSYSLTLRFADSD